MGFQIIVGRTEDGDVFRPSDWQHRLAGIASVFERKRIQFSDYLHPVWVDEHDISGVRVDEKLNDELPEIYDWVINFAQTNGLIIINGTK